MRLAIAAGAVLCLLAACRMQGAAEHTDPQIEGLLARMTFAEKIQLLHGAPEPDATNEGEAGYLPGIPRLGIAPLRFADGPPGVVTRHRSTAFTATMALAATFSREDARANGTAIARDARAAGVGLVLEPFINIYRDPSFERAYNTFGEDPLLTGVIGAAEIEGIQAGGIMAQAKHFIAYDGASEVTVDPQTLHEIYLPPFAAAVAAGVASIMCSYNVVNGEYACGNGDTLNSILRGELHFQGFVTSDWGAVHATGFINDGLDVEMPGSGSVIASYMAGTPAEKEEPGLESGVALGPPTLNHIPEETLPEPIYPPSRPSARPIGLIAALHEDSVTERTITQAVRRVLRELQRFGYLTPEVASSGRADSESPSVVALNAQVVRRTAQDAAVLLKNEADALPLRAEDLAALAMIGPGALQDVATGVSGEKGLGRIERQIGPSAALREEVGGPATGAGVIEAVADDMTGTPIPAAQLDHGTGAGLEREDNAGRALGIDAALDFTTQHRTALPPGTSARWSGRLRVPQSGRYRLYLQVLGAQGSLAVDGMSIASTTRLYLHGNVLQPGQDNVLPTRDGLDNVRRELELEAGTHAVSVQIRGEAAALGQPVQVRLAWVTPEERAADYEQAIRAAKSARKAVVFAWSRGQPVLQLPGDQDQLIADVAAVNPNTVVVLNVSEPVAMPWLDQVRAVLVMWFPGDEGGHASADLLLGHVSPGGRLPFTWPRRLEDGLANDPAHPERSSRGIGGATKYSEGIFVGYRWFDERHIEPLFPFGFGLSYTRFDYANLALSRGQDGSLDVSFELSNLGASAADEVPQLYLGPPPSTAAPAGVQFAPRALAAFDRVHLEPSEIRRVTLHAAARSFQYWSVARRQWVTPGGMRSVYVGASSRDVRLQAVAAPLRTP
jgi:beta-glucosidase